MLTFVGEKRDVLNLTFTPDGSTLAVGGGDPAIELWEVASGTVVGRIGVNQGYYHDALRFDPSGQWLLVAAPSRELTAHELHGQRAVALSDGLPARFFALSPVSDQVVYACGGNQYESVRMALSSWSSRSSRSSRMWEVDIFPGPGFTALSGAAFLSDGTHFASVEQTLTPERKAHVRLAIRDAATGHLVAEVELSVQYPDGLAVSPADTQVVVRSTMSLFVYNAGDPGARSAKVTNDNRKHFTGIAFHPSGKFLAATSNDKTVKFYDTASWTVAKTFTWNIGRLRSVAFSPDGLLAAAGSDTGKVVVWDVDV